MAKDFYETLGVDKKSSQADIKKAYRNLAKKYHPDANPGDKAAEERFKEISQAYDVVGDPEKRKQYDQFQEASSHGFAGGFPGYEGYSRGGAGGPGGFAREDLGGFEGFGDILSSLFGGGTTRMRKGRGQPFAEAKGAAASASGKSAPLAMTAVVAVANVLRLIEYEVS